MKIRLFYFLAVILTMLAGLASRKYGAHLPEWMGLYAGDALWAMLVYWLFRLIFPQQKKLKSAIFALAFAYFIEISQLYHAPWIDQLRHTRLGGLVLGFGFLWSDLVCYAIGIAVGFGLDSVSSSRT